MQRVVRPTPVSQLDVRGLDLYSLGGFRGKIIIMIIMTIMII